MPVFGKAKKKKKRERIPENLVYLAHFEFSIPTMTPEEYVAYLEQRFKKRPILISEDGIPNDDGRIPHTRYAIWPRGSQLPRPWYVGIIFRTAQDETIVTGSVGYGRRTVAWFSLLPVLYLLYDLLSKIGQQIGDIVVSFVINCVFFLIGYAIFYWGLSVEKRDTMRMLGYVPDG